MYSTTTRHNSLYEIYYYAHFGKGVPAAAAPASAVRCVVWFSSGGMFLEKSFYGGAGISGGKI